MHKEREEKTDVCFVFLTVDDQMEVMTVILLLPIIIIRECAGFWFISCVNKV